MTVVNDDILHGLTYEMALLSICDNDLERYELSYKECMTILSRIPVGWKE